VFIYLNEAIWGGDRKRSGVYKTIFTDKTRMMEPKFIDPFEVPNYAKGFAASNEDWFAPISLTDRRHAVFEVSQEKVDDFVYFKELFAAINGGEREAFLHVLLERKVDFDKLRRAPSWESELRRDQAERSLSPSETFVYELLVDGDLKLKIGDVKLQAHTRESYRKAHPDHSVPSAPSAPVVQIDAYQDNPDWLELWPATQPMLVKDELYNVFLAWCERQKIRHFPTKGVFFRDLNKITGLVANPDFKARFAGCVSNRTVVMNTLPECRAAWNAYAPAAAIVEREAG
jgi:hypothetical protein